MIHCSVLSDADWDLWVQGKWAECLTSRVNAIGACTGAAAWPLRWKVTTWKANAAKSRSRLSWDVWKTGMNCGIKLETSLKTLKVLHLFGSFSFHNKWTDISAGAPRPAIPPRSLWHGLGNKCNALHSCSVSASCRSLIFIRREHSVWKIFHRLQGRPPKYPPTVR